jgi:hypothetical protein
MRAWLLILLIVLVSGCSCLFAPKVQTFETMSPCQEALIDLNFAFPYAGGESMGGIR